MPPSRALREQIRAAARAMLPQLDRSRPLVRHEMEQAARSLLAQLDLPAAYVGWTMVALASSFWEDQVAAVPPERRLLLLPHCLRHAERCRAEYNALGLLCQNCGACTLAALKDIAIESGYRVLIAEGSPAVMRIILSGEVDALMGVACLDVLERTLDKILLAGIPCMAIPLVRAGCRDTLTDVEWIEAMVRTPHRPSTLKTRSYLHLMRAAAKLFEPDELDRLVPRRRSALRLGEAESAGVAGLEPLAATEAIAHDFLTSGGKHSRPFITLAVYDALLGGRGTLDDGATYVATLPDSVKCVALAIEVFHKASLVHDDIEDNDALRYGRSTLHHRFGVPAAINIGDYLIGLGYRLVSAQRDALGADMVADVLDQFAQAHTRLCEGQGAELLWRDAVNKQITPLDALRIYALKTAPAFEAAIMAGIRMAGPAERYHEAAARFARHLGVAYQMINDLDDWQMEPDAERPRGSDLLGGRPTVLWALALEALDAEDRRALLDLTESARDASCADSADGGDGPSRLQRAAELYAKAHVFGKASDLVRKHHDKACEAANAIDVEPLRRLFHFLADAILDRRPLSVSETR
ncbi:MAG: polyprenyl synthetase family protein [Planctomycetota bacterium]